VSEGADTGSGYEIVSRWYSGLGGLFTALAAAVLAFFVGGLVVVATGHDPFAAYKAIFSGTGLNWFFPWVQGDERFSAALGRGESGEMERTADAMRERSGATKVEKS